MNLSQKWLLDYVDVSEVEPHEFAEAMTMSGSKVEGYCREGADITGVVVGEILSVVKHPNADSLVICQVNIGEAEPVQIVTGATNVFAGAYVPVATNGSHLPGDKVIKKGKLRGEVSNGMLCSLSELGLTVHDFPYAIEDGIFILGDDCEKTPGMDIHEAIGLDDLCTEFEITSNRPDCLSVTGLAREAAVTFQKELHLPEPKVEKETGDIREHLSIEVQNPELCTRYIGRMVKNVKIGPSPRWMRERLRACGVRPINNIVDITNYVMLEYGQPMHAFDFKYVKGGKIIVRTAREDETSFMTLDGVTRTLSPEMLTICDAEGPTAVAGVMGGEFSSIMEDTDTILFESACFNGPSVRLTAKKLGMRTEASGRYEKGLDPATCLPAVQRACQLVELLGAGEVVGGMIDVDNSPKEKIVLPLEADWINRFLGINLPAEEMKTLLSRLGFGIEGDQVVVPSYRADVRCKADVAEEIARIYGYNNIPTTSLRGSCEGKLTPRQKMERRVNNIMLAQGYSEIMTYSFISPKYYDKIGLPADSALRKSVVISNPLGEDTSVMRTTTLPSMLEILSKNYANRNMAAALYEIGAEYIPQGENELPIETDHLTLGLYGDKADFYAIKGAVEALLDYLNIQDVDVEADSTNPTFHPGRCAVITAGGEELGVVGEVHPLVAENYEIGTRVYLAKLSMDALFAHTPADKEYKALPKYPASQRDIALLCNEELPVLTMEKAISSAVGSLLEKVELFDVYRGAQIPDHKKSVAFNLVLRSADHTLTVEEADAAVKRALKALSALNVTLRS
ncbi:phenylalanine--tRNA ligase subunit beta [Phocea massiliensis]|uniref:Phenylalanine--tRNA ligase beta subunit n=1 Tax=uncultured Anaerotruncus sp. TaxID=905011 RepID=A0A6N2S477_9FIRM|nr:phenylalanine--tRNA ligase subunit beta [Merdimmobilis hominis]MCD4836390.1 phenylalanine--tRNA ligase subunit beta [Merdimmobilis hominis]